MDLRSNRPTAGIVVVHILCFVGAILLLLLACTPVEAAPDTRDYVLPGQINGGYIVPSDRTENDGKTVQTKSATLTYRAFDGQSYQLSGHDGNYVRLLLPPGQAAFTEDHIEELVDQLDMHYALYSELMHGEPMGNGLLSVAFLPETCGQGCGLLGARGIEILADEQNYTAIARELNEGRLEAVLVHELAHNFDLYAEYLHYLPDHPHAWTDMFEFFAPYRYARATRRGEAPDDVYRSPVSSVWKQYVVNQDADWDTCVKGQACLDSGLTANNLWAMVYYRIEHLHGIEALLGSFDYLAEHVGTMPLPETAEEKEGLRIKSLAAGAGTNIACYMDALKWPLSDTVRSELQRDYGRGAAQCDDLDGDGFTAINGDCDENDPGRNLLAVENPGNGIDDDCDGQTDEQHLVESEWGKAADNFNGTTAATLPFQVDGSASHGQDNDVFRFPLYNSNRAWVSLCSEGAFRGWVSALRPDGTFIDTANYYIWQPTAGCSSTTFDFGGLSEGRLAVMPDGAAGTYALTVNRAASLLPEHVVYLQAGPRPSGGLDLQVNDPDELLASLGTNQVEFWISGAAITLTRHFTPGMKISLPPSALPGLVNGNDYQVRMRPLRDGMPLADFSAAQRVHYRSTLTSLPVLDSGYSGAWFDPGHDGEGFIVELLADQKALVYWFTYDGRGQQRWMLGVGPVKDNRITIHEMMDASGGRFGDDFNPDDVSLRTVGSMSIQFLDCTRAIANYSIDDRGGHQDLVRLSSLDGHGCGRAQTPPALDLSGSWFDPAHNGEGFTVQQLDDGQALVVWFSYDEDGKQAWMLSLGETDRNRISFPEMQQPTGGIFGRGFNPATVSRQEWGNLTLDLDCNGGTANYASKIPGYPPGTQTLAPLTRLQSSGCL